MKMLSLSPLGLGVRGVESPEGLKTLSIGPGLRKVIKEGLEMIS